MFFRSWSISYIVEAAYIKGPKLRPRMAPMPAYCPLQGLPFITAKKSDANTSAHATSIKTNRTTGSV